ncbi:MFS transporter [Streptomyces sp. Ru73]|uniref:MFS transporter n=1 Tax=Streptomyces sp. Ru73 TaxID=2080748 RepID=UPI0015E36A68|nr:MFS transporter [Streptomyces sp. Ru73]
MSIQPTAARTAPEAVDGHDTAGALLARVDRIPLTRFHLRIAGLLGVGTFFDSFDALLLSVVLSAVLATLGAPLSVAGALIAAGYVGQIIGALVFGVVSERVGRKAAFVAASALFGLLSLCAAVAWNVESMMAFRFVQGMGLGAEVPVAAAMFNEFVGARARGRIVLAYESLFLWGVLGATLLGAAFLAAFPPETAWRSLFVLAGVPVLTALWAWFRLPESPRHLVHRGALDRARSVVEEMEASARDGGHALEPVVPPATARPVVEPRTRFGELFSPAYRARTAALWCVWFTTFLPLGGFTTWMPTLLMRVGGLPPARASLLTGGIVVGNLAVLYLTAWSLDRLGRRFWFAAGYGLALFGSVGGAVALGVLGQERWDVLFAAGALVLLGVNINAPLIYLYTAELYPTRMRAWATMTGSTMRNLASVVAPITIGLLLGARTGVLWSFVLSAAVLLTGLAVVLRYGVETKQRSLEELAR